MSQIVIISGPPGAGKSSVARALCERYDRTVHIETDQFFAAIRMGLISPWKAESDRQNHMVSRAAARAASAYAEELFGVFIDGVIGPHVLPEYLRELTATSLPVHFVLVAPSLDAIVARGTAREDTIRVPPNLLRRGYETFREWGSFAGATIDNTSLTAEQTADLVMEACERGEALVQAAA
jgi:chloramphenicol 3-O-phosphotransferase